MKQRKAVHFAATGGTGALISKTIKKARPKGEPLPRGGLVLLGAMSLFWGMAWPAMKIVLGELQPWTFRSICLVSGGLGVLILAKLKDSDLSFPLKELTPLLLVSLLNITGWHLCSAYGIKYMPAGRAVIVGYTMPLWATILGSIILKERLTLLRVAGLVFGLSGLAVLIWPDVKVLEKTPLGVVFMLGAAISWGAGTAFIKYFEWTMSTILLTGWQLIIGSIPVVIGALFLEPVTAISHLSYEGVLALTYVIIFPMLFCHLSWFTVVKIFPASVASIGTLAIPIVGVFSSSLVLGEKLGYREVMAMILVVIALGIVLIGPTRPPEKAIEDN